MARFSHVIPARVRRGAVRILARYGVAAEDVVGHLETTVGFVTRDELFEALGETLGGDAAAEFDRRFQDAVDRLPLLHRMTPERGDPLRSSFPEVALVAVPDHLFNAALERARH